MSNNRTIPENAKGSSVTFSLKIEGQTLPGTYEVKGITVLKEANRIPSAKILLLDGDPAEEKFAASNDAVFEPGKTLEIFVGHQAQEDLLFRGIIVKHALALRKNGGSVLKLECKDKAFQMTLGRKSRYFIDVKDSAVATQLANDYGLNPNVEDTALTYSQLVQYDVSDWDFMLSRMDVNGKVVLLNNGELKAMTPDFSSNPILSLQYGATIHEFDAEMDARNQYKAVKAIAWDYSTQNSINVEAQEPGSVQENGNLKSSQLAEATGLDFVDLRFAGKMDQQELQTIADAYWQKSRMAKIRGQVKFDGFAKVKPGDILTLSGISDRFNGKTWVSGIRHDVGDGNWTTVAQFGLDPDWFVEKNQPSLPGGTGQLSMVKGLHTGVVTQLENDPEGESRIQLKLPLVDFGNDGIWARVATLDAGKERGSFFLPDIDDEVLVGFLNNDPKEAVILGMLHSSDKPTPLPYTNDNKEKGLFFASKMKVSFHEEDKSITLETPAGNSIVLSEKDKGISIQDQNGNKIVMNKDGITIESSKKMTLKASSGDISLEGLNVKQKASAQFKAEGGSGMEISSSAMTVLKGSLVKIN